MNFDFSPMMAFFNAFTDIVTSALNWILSAFVKLIWGVLYIVVDGLLTVVTGFVGLIDLSTITTNALGSIGILPDLVLWVLNQSGIPQGLAIIGYAIMIRMMLNLIPGVFTRV